LHTLHKAIYVPMGELPIKSSGMGYGG